MTQPLSPAAQAIDEIIGDLYEKPVRYVVAAALRAVARQPYEVRADIRGDDYCHYCAGVEAERNRNLAIAAELEGQPSPNPQPNPPPNHAEERSLDPQTGRAGHDQAIRAGAGAGD